MQYIRWYDKNQDLKSAFEIIEKLDYEQQSAIAKDIVQMLVSDFNLNLDEQINQISREYNYSCKRWYDNNVDLFTSFEIIRKLPEALQNIVAQNILSTILLMYMGNI